MDRKRDRDPGWCSMFRIVEDSVKREKEREGKREGCQSTRLGRKM